MEFSVTNEISNSNICIKFQQFSKYSLYRPSLAWFLKSIQVRQAWLCDLSSATTVASTWWYDFDSN